MIKFKAFLKRKNKIVDVKAIQFNKSSILYEDKSNEYFGVDMYYVEVFKDIELLQYTGLKDKNGIEIYEGYIVECEGEICIVVWNDYYLAYTLYCKDFGYDNLGDFESKYLEVIGNIYENPELLEVKYETETD